VRATTPTTLDDPIDLPMFVDPRSNPTRPSTGIDPKQLRISASLLTFNRLSRAGRIYEVQRWILLPQMQGRQELFRR
jgi:hypothetical protein